MATESEEGKFKSRLMSINLKTTGEEATLMDSIREKAGNTAPTQLGSTRGNTF